MQEDVNQDSSNQASINQNNAVQNNMDNISLSTQDSKFQESSTHFFSIPCKYESQ
ncbi:hypothetical protein [Helicobacter trogontum]|uniref:hypothetical protein n=1 Tax=Helicobacter trogontum TaxID=50960 RepID=UPI000A849D2A|nr:hypothetical protein [Helicobacter trogontum]